MQVEIGRRGLLKGLGLLIAAPAIVRAESLMKITAPKLELLPPGIYDMIIQDTTIIEGTIRTRGMIVSALGNFVLDFNQNILTLK